ncbi:MAG TPA: putative DNA-binding domain-containing protein [Candidatus Aquabacterium excrementipullorum]|nr:putative DNA-binding domain-containing protein [Candidatus Aquabacterium excrementipullorum]
MSTDQTSLRAFQQALGLHLRDPRRAPRLAGLAARRAGIYGELVFNNLAGLLSPCFPVTQAVLGARWSRLVRQFCREGQCETPLFREVPGEFMRWLLATADTDVPLPPWLRELAHHEWSELAVETAPFDEAPRWVDIAAASDSPVHWHDQVPCINPALMNLHYQWPVHRIGPDFRPRRPVPTFMLVYRDREEAVCFAQLNAVSSRLLHIASTSGLTARKACESVATELGQAGSPELVAQALTQLQTWRMQGVLWESDDAENNDAI